MKRTSLILLIVLTLALLLETFSLAWVSDNGLSSIINVSGSVHKNYFEYGEGTKEKPYGIANPVQLYYFSWLQYLGFFNNTDNDGDGYLDSFYFEIDPDLEGGLNMEGYKLPPIGTTENPFIGNFNGHGKTISNLTVRNFYNYLSAPPSGTDDFGGAEIIGFFGVIGSLPNPDYKYHTQENEVKNLALENVTIITQTNQTLVGIVAGYVNGIVDCVGVIGGNVNIISDDVKGALTEYTNNFSDYSLIGYCTAEYKDSVYVMDVTISNPGISGIYNVVPDMTSDGEGHGWGGSVKMLDIYTWLSAIRDSNNVSSTNGSYITQRVDNVKLNGIHHTINSTTASKKTASIDGFGKFVYTTLGADYNFMAGATSVEEHRYDYAENYVSVYYITDGDGNYLSFNGTNIVNYTNQASATKWYISNGTNGGVISTVVNDTLYYLTIANGAITTIEDFDADINNLPTWEVSEGTLMCNDSSIECVEGIWQLSRLDNVKIQANNGSNNFLDVATNSTTAVGNATNDRDAATWSITAVNGGFTVSTIINNNTYYLGYESETTGNGWFNQETPTELILSTTPTTWQFSNNQLYVEVGNWWTTTYYVGYQNGAWTISTTQYTPTLTGDMDANVDIVSSGETAKEVVYTVKSYIDNSLENYRYNENGQKEIIDEAGITYFPLSSTVNVGQNSYEISSNNTGYIVSAQWGDIEKDEYDSYGNVRISRYAANSMTNYTTPWTMTHKTEGKFKTITKENADQTTVTDADKATFANLGLMKYADCYSDYRTSITNYCYGLHFMTASVSLSNLVRITATLNGDVKENYQVPTNCIDFNLYDRGFINFVAGSYYTQTPNNDSFFSIYEITRDPDDETTITDIKEISKIYAKLTSTDDIDTSKEYYYTYNVDGNEVGANGVPTGYEVVFDCRWITHPNDSAYYDRNATGGNPTAWSNNRAFYFEVPVNAGEYAIGSTEGRTGAYLVYLDLAANAQIIERQKDYEKIVEEKEAGSLPHGVELLAPGETITNGVDPSSSAFVSINKVGEIVFSTTDGVTITHTAKDGTSAEYIGPGVTLKDGNGNIMQMQGVTTTIERTTYRDHNLNTGEYTVTVITKTTVGSNVTYGRTITKGTWNSDTNSPENMVLEEDIDNQPGELFPTTKDSVVGEGGGAVGVDSLIKLYYSYGQSVNLTVKYEYTYSESNPSYNITVTHDGADDVNVKAVLTSAGVSSNLTFYINGQVLNDTVDPQTVTVSGTPAEG